jgi:hypothetical protein
MPRKAPGPNNGVTEHRITFGNTERKLIKETSTKMAWGGVAEGVGSAVGGLGIAGAAIAALIYVGFNIDDFIDNRSTRIVTWLEKNGYVVYWAPVYGMKLKEAEDELAALFEEMQSINLDTEAGKARYAACQARWNILIKRIKVLTIIIGQIADGTFKGKGWSGNQSGTYADTRMEYWYDYYGGQKYGEDYDDDAIAEGDSSKYANS